MSVDRLDAMQLFIRVVERSSFTAAAADLGLPRSTATELIQQTEKRLGTRLLERTTRHVQPTLDGQAYYHRCVTILAEIDDAESAFRDVTPHGLLRIDAHPFLTRTFLMPRLMEFLDRYPAIDLQIGQGDRLVDLVREGVDCVIRAGEQPDSGLILRRLAMIEEVTCASPSYLARHGVPQSLDELDRHQVVGFISSRTGEIMPLEFMVDGKVRLVRLPGRVTVNNSDTGAELARLGLGLVQAPRYRFRQDLEDGTLVEVMQKFPPPPTPLSALYPQNRQLTPRLRVFLEWVSNILGNAAI